MTRLFLPSSLAASVLASVAVWSQAPQWWPLLLALLATLLLVLSLAAMNPRWQWYGAVVSRGPQACPQVALTFDDGPHPVHTRHILDLLDAAGARATFFMVGGRARAAPDLAREVADRGHQIGHHSEHHRWSTMLSSTHSAADLRAGSQSLVSATGRSPRFFRPPIGMVTPELLAAVDAAEMVPVLWSLRSFDGRAVDPQRVVDRVLSSVRGGDIVLLHDASPPHRSSQQPAAVAALPAILAGLAERNLESVTIAELLGEQPYFDAPTANAVTAPVASPLLARLVAATLAVIVAAAAASALAAPPPASTSSPLSDGFPPSFVAAAVTLAGHSSVQSRFRQVKNSQLFVDEVVQTGLLQLRSAERRLLWSYDEGPRLLLAEGRFFVLADADSSPTPARRLPPPAARMARMMEALFFLRLSVLEEHFSVVDSGAGWFHLSPHRGGPRAAFASVRLRIGGEPLVLEELVMEEAGGDVTTIVFSDMQLGLDLPAALFARPGERVSP
jgi:peptidoglycan/xylan/chitin deacetylase (PgdA/CDA1 family)